MHEDGRKAAEGLIAMVRAGRKADQIARRLNMNAPEFLFGRNDNPLILRIRNTIEGTRLVPFL